MSARKLAVWKLSSLLEKNKNGLPLEKIYSLLIKPYGLTRGELRSARKELGVLSEQRNGEIYWRKP